MLLKRRLRLVFLSIFLMAVNNHAAIASSSELEERLFKAAFIYNFAKFTTWPEKKWNYSDDQLTLCTIGYDKLTQVLKRLQGKKIRGRNLQINNQQDLDTTDQCHLLYIALSEKNNIQQLIESLGQRPILSISELDKFAESGGMVELQNHRGKTQLVINLDSIRESDLFISSRLLMMSKVIEQSATQ